MSIQLTHPELMSKEALLQVLNNRCIEVPSSKMLNKAELVEIFRRVALPLPQRDHAQARHVGKRMAFLRASKSIPVASFEENSDLAKLSCNDGKLGRLKPGIQANAKISFSNNSKSEKDNVKRKFYEKSDGSPMKQDLKRQKITWP